ncbi:M23 family metallopeptidase [Demequina litorisediminis]|uniref:Uncharacterized protein n=1 Tax=Demequina litorisediminis TaxID=1849022 RepID=A0ABQ6IIR0_9MICO|nr:hypothetical protein [Demequina litorisediminis]GMA37808.1 hypothetical protein GCM10025876_40120 [Demequina litorisediminis]
MAEGGRGGLAAAGVVAVFVAPIFLVLGLAVIGGSDADAANVCVAQPSPSPSTSSTAVVDETCTTSQVSLSGWAHPTIPTARVTSSFSPSRFHPTLHIWRAHLGTDYSAGSCGEAIYAAHDGTVTFAGMSGNWAWCRLTTATAFALGTYT